MNIKVNHFSTYPYGGAANAALRIHRGLCHQEFNSQFLYRINEREKPSDLTLQQIELEVPVPTGLWAPLERRRIKQRQKKVHQLYDRHLADRSTELEVFAMARLPRASKLDWTKHNSDIVHLHWVAHFFDYPSFFESIPNRTPIVWTLHDMAPFSGGCHYSGPCTKFRNGCGNCPQVVAPFTNDVSRDSLESKRRALSEKRIHVVAPSTWLIDHAKSSQVWPDATEFSVIHYGLDLKRFYPMDQVQARQDLGVHSSRTLIGFGAEDIQNPRKGFRELCQSLRALSASQSDVRSEIEIAVFGRGDIPEDLKTQFRIHSFGFVKDVDQLAKIYSACDMIVVPSLEDNQPQVGLEAMACGRAVIGFRAGGIPEYVMDRETGLLVDAPLGDQSEIEFATEFAAAIIYLAENKEVSQRMGIQGRKKVELDFEMDKQTSAYVQLYQGLVGDQNEFMKVA